MLPWTWMYKYLFQTLISVLFGIQPEVELLDHMVIPFWIFWRNAMLFSPVAAPFHMPLQHCTRVPRPCQHVFSGCPTFSYDYIWGSRCLSWSSLSIFNKWLNIHGWSCPSSTDNLGVDKWWFSNSIILSACIRGNYSVTH